LKLHEPIDLDFVSERRCGKKPVGGQDEWPAVQQIFGLAVQ
jgi:hypothetical protein